MTEPVTPALRRQIGQQRQVGDARRIDQCFDTGQCR